MAYTILKTNGVSLGTIADGTIDNKSKTSLVLIGRNYSNYGQLMANNLVSLLENFANSTANEPPNPLAGQLWWNTTDRRMRVYTGTEFKVISSCLSQSTAPVTTVAGDLWWDETEEQLYVYNGTNPYTVLGWILVGPTYKKTRGKSGAIWETISDGTVDHSVLSLYLDGARHAVLSKDANFTPVPSITGFGVIYRGHTANTSIAGGNYYITANNANYLGNVISDNYLRADINNIAQGNLRILNNNGITVGSNLDFAVTIPSSGQVNLTNRINNGDTTFVANVSGVLRNALVIDGATGLITVYDNPTTNFGIATKKYVDDKFDNAVLTGVSTAITMPADTANLAIATTEWVVSYSGFLKNRIYQGNSYVEVLDTGTGALSVVVDGATIATGTASGFNLFSGATATTQPQTYTSAGNAAVATTQYVRTAGQWWGGSAKFVSVNPPNLGVNDIGSNDGDFWFQYQV